jgi:hypothetical protein
MDLFASLTAVTIHNYLKSPLLQALHFSLNSSGTNWDLGPGPVGALCPFDLYRTNAVSHDLLVNSNLLLN